jgi:hypothetical protein
VIATAIRAQGARRGFGRRKAGGNSRGTLVEMEDFATTEMTMV